MLLLNSGIFQGHSEPVGPCGFDALELPANLPAGGARLSGDAVGDTGCLGSQGSVKAAVGPLILQALF